MGLLLPSLSERFPVLSLFLSQKPSTSSAHPFPSHFRHFCIGFKISLGETRRMDETKGKPKDQKETVPDPPANFSSTLPPPIGESAVKEEERKVLEMDGAAKGGKVSSLKLSGNPPSSSSSSSAATVPTDPELQKKFRRAERFGLPVQLSEEEKRSSRSQRFGLSSPHGPGESTKSEEDKKKARAERFGLPASTPVDEEAKKKARLARFTPVTKVDAVEEDKRKARAIRFAKPASDGTSEANGQVKTEMLQSV